ncbi:hypothetical protein VKT23_003247 [Stygiomarasmius scandens]|uniref:Zn(2)-C6 fungal-type domain-containing protein n=1 Tax=Marasmiellus scandens TaxID=2682957 RepID=A0ABR1JXD8_9AGAR
MDDHRSPAVQYPEFLREEDERFYAAFPNARPVHPEWQMQSLSDNFRDFGSTAFYFGQPQVNQYPPDNLNYSYSQYAFGEPSSSFSYAQPMPYTSDTVVPQPSISSDSELAHAQDIFTQQSVMSDFSSGSSASPENLYSPVEDSHQFYASSSQYPSQPSIIPSPSATLPDAAESPEDLSSSDSKPPLKRRRDTDFGAPSFQADSPRAYMSKIPLQKPPQPSAPKATKTRNPAQGEKKSLALACFFCRGRKIACGRQDPNSPDRTCNQCFRRSLKCEYPTESRRGMRKKKTVVSDNSMRALAAD